MTFWDFCAPFYDIAEKANGQAYSRMLVKIRELIPQGSSVLEAAAGTGSISLAVADRASHVLCTDISKNMLNIAKRKASKANTAKVMIENRSIYDLAEPDSSYDSVIAGQVLHLIDEPQKAATELMRVAKTTVIMPMSFTKNLRGTAKFNITLYRLFGFSPKIEFTSDEYIAFLQAIGFYDCEFIQIDGKIPMGIAIWKKKAIAQT